MHRLRLRAVRLELLLVALFPAFRNRRQATTVYSALEAQPSLRGLADEHRLAARRQAPVAFLAPIGERLDGVIGPTISMPSLIVARNDVESAPFATQGIDECPQAHSPSLPSGEPFP